MIMLKKLSVIIPTYNAEHYLPLLLKYIKTQTIDFELIVIDSSSTDNTVSIAREYTQNIIVIPQNEFDHGSTRTKAAKIAKGDILIFLTQDALPFDEFTLENILKVFENQKIGAAYGRQIPYENTTPFGKHLRMFNYGEQSYVRSKKDIRQYGLKTAFLSDSFAAYRKSTLEAVGWFKDGLIVGEDTFAGAKMILDGHSLAYVAEAKVYHSHSYTVWQEFQRYFDIGVFHRTESWILEAFGKAEGEGLRYLKSELKYLLDNRFWYLIPEFFIRNVMKYTGYKLGQNYKKLPLSVIKKCSMHLSWWDKSV